MLSLMCSQLTKSQPASWSTPQVPWVPSGLSTPPGLWPRMLPLSGARWSPAGGAECWSPSLCMRPATPPAAYTRLEREKDHGKLKWMSQEKLTIGIGRRYLRDRGCSEDNHPDDGEKANNRRGIWIKFRILCSEFILHSQSITTLLRVQVQIGKLANFEERFEVEGEENIVIDDIVCQPDKTRFWIIDMYFYKPAIDVPLIRTTSKLEIQTRKMKKEHAVK